jgi:cellulose synthase (UDP-forming)
MKAILLALVAVLATVPAFAQEGASPSAKAAQAAAFPTTGYISYSFSELGAPPRGLRLVEGAAEGGVTYMVRRDQVITAARLRLMLANSAGFPPNTKLDVTINGDSVGTVDVGANTHTPTPVELPIDPVLLGDYNRVSFKLVGVAAAACTVNEGGPWLTVAPRSAVDIVATHLPLANDLAILPLPFFDERDPHVVKTGFVFPHSPSPGALEASGIVASWLGSLAKYRGVHLPASFGNIPPGNAIVFVAGNQTIPGLTLPHATGPTLAMVTNPNDPGGKLLLVLGRDAADLKLAAQGLALGNGAYKEGAVSAVATTNPPPRHPYDAPGWIADTKPVKFADLATPDQLRSRGMRPAPIMIDFRSAPDYFNWVDSAIPMKLRFGVAPEPVVDLAASRLDVALNNSPFASVPLADVGTLLTSARARHAGEVDMPPFLLTGRNRLSFFFDLKPTSQCTASRATGLVARIDPDSTIDLSQSPHYAPMPNLSFFANTGFPFTRDADLSETAVVMPDEATPGDTEAFLDTMALFGEATGYPTLRASVTSAAAVSNVADRDLLLIGSFTRQPLLAGWTGEAGLAVGPDGMRARPRSLWERIQATLDWHNRRSRVADVNEWLSAPSAAGEGAILEFRSPLRDGRTVVAITGNAPAAVARTARMLQTADQVAKVQDDLVVMRGGDVRSFRMSRRYEIGSLARWTWLRWNLSDQPIVIAILLFAACAALGAVAFVVLGIKGRRRLQGANR